MSNKNRCVFVTSLILLISYEVATQNYYHTFDKEIEGDYDLILNKPNPEYLFGSYGNPISPQKTILNGDYRNIQRPIPNALYNYPVTFKPSIQEVPAKIMNIPPINNNKDTNENITPKIDAYLVENEPNNSYHGEYLKLATKENGEALNNNNAPKYKPQINSKSIKDGKQADGMKNETLVPPVRNETTSDIVNFDNEKDKNCEIISPIDTINVLPSKAKAEEVQLIGEPFIKIMNLNIGDNLPGTKSNIGYNKSLLQNLNMKKLTDHEKKIEKKVEITLPESDTTTVIISSRNENKPLHTKEEPLKNQNSHLAHQQISVANNLKHNRRNSRPNDKAIEFNKNEPVDLALNRKIWPIPLTYAINSHIANTPFYSLLYPNNNLYPRL